MRTMTHLESVFGRREAPSPTSSGDLVKLAAMKEAEAPTNRRYRPSAVNADNRMKISGGRKLSGTERAIIAIVDEPKQAWHAV